MLPKELVLGENKGKILHRVEVSFNRVRLAKIRQRSATYGYGYISTSAFILSTAFAAA